MNLRNIMEKIEAFVKKHPVASLAGYVAVMLSIGTLGMEITRINIRFALMTQEMAHQPIGCFPTINGHPYADYPVLYNLFSYWTSFGARFVNHFTLSLPTILFSCYTLVMTAKIGERIRPGLGIAAALFSLLSLEYLNIFIQFSIDMPVAAAAVTIVYFLLKYDYSFRALPIYMLCLAGAFLIRGPLGIILAGGVAAGVIVGARRWMAILTFGAAGALTAALCLALSVWAIRAQGGDGLLRDVIEWQVSSRIEGGDIFYYFTNAMGSFALTSFMALSVVLMKRRELIKPPLAPLFLWILLPMILLSIPGCKHLRYLSPALPGFALVAAYGYTAPDDSLWAKILLRGTAFIDRIFYPLIGTAICVFTVYLCFTPHVKFIGYSISALAVLTLIFFALRGKSGKLLPPLRLALYGTAFVALIYPPVEAVAENASLFVNAAEARRRGGLYFFRMGPDHDDLKYLFHLPYEKRGTAIYLSLRGKAKKHGGDGGKLLDRMYPVKSADEVIPALGPNDMIITVDKRYKALVQIAGKYNKQINTVVKGQLGHREAMAVTLTDRAPAGEKKP